MLGCQDMTTEHTRLAEACSAFFEAFAPDFAGDMPQAMQALANGITRYIKPDDETLACLRRCIEDDDQPVAIKHGQTVDGCNCSRMSAGCWKCNG